MSTPALLVHPQARLVRQGLGLVEVLISLAIAAGLLTATAVALDASTKAYAINQEHASLMQQARVALNRMTTAVRTSKAHAPDDAASANAFAGGTTVVANSIALFDDSGSELVFSYDPTSKCILLKNNGESHVLARGVDAFSVRMEPMRSARSIRTGGGWDLLRRASFVLTIRTTSETALQAETTRQQTVTLSASVTPRRNSW